MSMSLFQTPWLRETRVQPTYPEPSRYGPRYARRRRPPAQAPGPFELASLQMVQIARELLARGAPDLGRAA